MKKRWVPIVNFIRYDEPREPGLDLFEPVREQMKLAKKYNLPVTWLMQPDAMLAGPYPGFFMENMPENHELGVWLEITRMHCDYAGVKFNGRGGINWDYHSRAALTIGYSPEDRIKLADAAMEIFKDKFGHYPETVAAWYIDAFTLDYLCENYSICASANCRDQWGTDGYSLWGGVWSGGYYPSKHNAMLPAVSIDNQINIPVFRMLGSCPVNQYDCEIGENGQEVFTLEPVYEPDREWVEKLFSNMFDIIPYDYSFVQVGQENSFGWSRMRESYELQMRMLYKYSRRKQIDIATLREIGIWYQKKYKVTAPVGVAALKDTKTPARQSFWYNSRRYRVNLILEEGTLRLRDLHMFSDSYAERYFNNKCYTANMTADALPVVEGFLWKNYLKTPDMCLEVLKNGSWCSPEINAVEYCHNHLKVNSELMDYDWIFEENQLVCKAQKYKNWRLLMPCYDKIFTGRNGNDLNFTHEGFKYGISTSGAENIMRGEHNIILEPETDNIILKMQL